jgi:hypothetical protein
MGIKRIQWIIKRHPFLYVTRFRLVSKNTSIAETHDLAYNTFNAKSDIPSYFHEVNSQIFKGGRPIDVLDSVIQLCTWLQLHIKGGPGLSYASDVALKKMLAGEGGVCSDRVQIFNNFCVLNDIQVREWGVTSIPFDKWYGGHSFNEVYVPAMNKWITIDVSYCGFFYAGGKPLPLSTIELFELIRKNTPVHFETFYDTKINTEKNIQKNYLHPNASPFLVSQYKNRVYDRYLKRFRRYLPVFMIHFMVYLSGKSYRYQFPLDDYKQLFS